MEHIYFLTQKHPLLVGAKKVNEELHLAIFFLRGQGLTTPEICQQLAIDSDKVIEVLLQGSVVPKQGTVELPKRPVGRPRKLSESNLLPSIAQLITKRRNSKASLWTFPALLQAIRSNIQKDLSQDTFRRYLKRQGFTFDAQLEQVLGCSKFPIDAVTTSSKWGIVYVVTHRIIRQREEGLNQATTVITGITAFNRIAVMAQSQSRLSPGMLVTFLYGLLSLHPDRRIVVILSAKGVYRSVVHERSFHRVQRLQLYLAKNNSCS